MTVENAPFRHVDFMPVDLDVRRTSDGIVYLRSNVPLPPYDANLPRWFGSTAAIKGGATALAARNAGGDWETTSYEVLKRQVDAAAQWLLDNITRGRSVLVIGENSPAIAIMGQATLAAGVICCPVGTTALMSSAAGERLRHVIAKARPEAIFIHNSEAIETLVRANADDGIRIITSNPGAAQRGAIDWADVLATTPTSDVADSIAALDVTAPATYMMTSGSTGLPKLVETSLANMAAAAMQGIKVTGADIMSGTILDWMPWHHAAGAGLLKMVLLCGGTLYIDDGKPLPGLFDRSIRNHREVSARLHADVPQAYGMLADAMEADAELRSSFFRNLHMLIYGGAGLPQDVYDRLQAMAVAETGHRIQLSTGYGMTETVTGCLGIHFPTTRVGLGLPLSGTEMKLVPNDERYEVRLRGPSLMIGYVDEPEISRDVLDEEGFYRTGDLAMFHDNDRPEEGLRFAGRLAEEFKLLSGTWVYGGQLRVTMLAALSEEIAELVVCGDNQGYVALMLWPKRAPDDAMRVEIVRKIAQHNALNGGSSTLVRRVTFFDTPPNPAGGELSDKGTINRKAVLRNRADVVDRLYAEIPDDNVLVTG